MPQHFSTLDLGSAVVLAGGAEPFFSANISLHDVPSLAAACAAQRAALAAERASAAAASVRVRAAAGAQLAAARVRLGDASARAAAAVTECGERRSRLEAVAAAFEERRVARAEEDAVETCRGVADRYLSVMQGLQCARGGGEGMDAVAGEIGGLIEAVQAVRRAGPRALFGESLGVNKRILASMENRCVDAVVKARAAFVNVMDNEFRAFGWPMRVPVDGEMVELVNYYVRQMHMLQRVAEGSAFVERRTRWHRSLSDSWAVATILRAPLARFKYHFLENYRAAGAGDAGDDDNASTSSSVVVEAEAAAAANSAARASTTRFDRPEWAADFALARIEEAAPFLKQIVLDDTCTADLKYADGFCKVFANKIAYDADIAIRGKGDEEGADGCISHAANTCASFDAKIRAGIVHNNPIFHADDKLPSALDILSTYEDFFANWALSEQRIAQVSVLEAVDSMLARGADGAGVASGTQSDFDLEMECSELVDRISQASRGCRGLESRQRMLVFVKWTELKLLEAVRNRLREVLLDCGWEPVNGDDVFKVARASWIAHALSLALESKACDRFYVALEEENGVVSSSESGAMSTVYDTEVERLRDLSKRAADCIAGTLCANFTEAVTEKYQSDVHFGEIDAPNAAVVLAHDLSQELCECMGVLEVTLASIAAGVQNQKIAASIWRPVASQLDEFFFNSIILQAWTGGIRNAVSAASSANEYMVATSAAKMARQVAHDASVLVGVFGSVTRVPKRWLPRCADASRIIGIGAARTLRPRAAVRQEDEEVLAAVVSGDVEKPSVAEGVGIERLSAREARECLVVAGMYDMIPME